MFLVVFVYIYVILVEMNVILSLVYFSRIILGKRENFFVFFGSVGFGVELGGI